MSFRIALLTVMMFSFIRAQDKGTVATGNRVTILGAHYSFTTTIPSGWILDSTDAIKDQRDIRFRKESGADKFRWMIYVAAASKVPEGEKTLGNLLAWFTVVDSAKKVTPLPDMKTNDNKIVIRRQWEGKWGMMNLGCKAFIEDEQFVAVLELMSRNEEDYRQAMPAFQEVLESYSSVAKLKK